VSFQSFDLSDLISAGLRDMQYKEPTPIQQHCIPPILAGKDVLGSAQTGTGKTGAFVVPLLQKIVTSKKEGTQALILAPTRELARQIDEQIVAIGYHTEITSAIVIGGSDFAAQAKAIRNDVDILVATPGRLLDQMNVLGIDFSHIRYLVLDEGDRMLDMGFLPDVSKIISKLPDNRQTLLFSATLPKELKRVVPKIMKNPEKVAIAPSKPVESVSQQIYFVSRNEKLRLVEHLFSELSWETALIFTATKQGTDQLEHRLNKRGIKTIGMHGDRSQEERNKALRAFKNKKYPVMVATDVLSRGIDIDNISLILNYNVPHHPDDYIHRIGRTGRYDQTGTAITLVQSNEKKYYQAIKQAVGNQLLKKKLPDAIRKKQPQKQSSRKKQNPKKTQQSTCSKGNKQKVRTDTQKPRPSSQKKKTKKGSKRQLQKQPQKKKNYRSEDFTAPRTYRPKEKEKTSITEPAIVEKATKRNQRARKPSKGLYGIIKSLIPTFKR
jgi:superfamily II DNA/RNA helicase